jgi:hypothetical protein
VDWYFTILILQQCEIAFSGLPLTNFVNPFSTYIAIKLLMPVSMPATSGCLGILIHPPLTAFSAASKDTCVYHFFLSKS